MPRSFNFRATLKAGPWPRLTSTTAAPGAVSCNCFSAISSVGHGPTTSQRSNLVFLPIRHTGISNLLVHFELGFFDPGNGFAGGPSYSLRHLEAAQPLKSRVQRNVTQIDNVPVGTANELNFGIALAKVLKQNAVFFFALSQDRVLGRQFLIGGPVVHLKLRATLHSLAHRMARRASLSSSSFAPSPTGAASQNRIAAER